MVFAYFAGLLTLPALVAAYFLLNWAFSRTQAYGECLVCEHLQAREIGDNFNIVEVARVKWHDLWWSHRSWHRTAVKAYWAKHQ